MGKTKAELEEIPGAARRGRGRPPGSKNKKKLTPESSGAKAEAVAGGPSGVPSATPEGPQLRLVNPLHHVPPELLQSLALMPETLVAAYVGKKTGGEVHLQVPREAARAVVAATDAWLKSLDFELTPGWALLGAHVSAVSAMFLLAGEELKKKERNGASAPEVPSAPGVPEQPSGSPAVAA